MQAKHLLIAGAGIAGLSHALALCRSGHRVQVLEQAAQMQAIGAGIQLGPNALRRLDQLGLLAALESKAAQPNAVVIRSLSSGRLIKKLDLKAIQNRYGYPVVCIHRAALQQILLDACLAEPHFSLLTNQRLESVQNTASGVQAKTSQSDNNASRSTQLFEADALIAADGLWSSTRQQLFGDGPPDPTGKIAFRALLPLSAFTTAGYPDDLADQTGLWLGANAHIVHYPVGDSNLMDGVGAQLNVIVMMRGNHRVDHWQHASSKAFLLQQLQTAHPKPIASAIKHLLDSIDICSSWTLFDRPVLNRWQDGNICLTGDAAHPMQAHLAQGASMAIEDAQVMNDALNSSATIAAAFAKFNELRLRRTSLAMRKAKQYGNIYQAKWPISVGRDWFLKSPISSWNAAGMDWLYRG